MYFDVLASDELLVLNTKLIKLLGLSCATYTTVLVNIANKAFKKKKFDQEGFIKLDRNYIKDISSLSAADQLKCDKMLVNLGILKVAEADSNQVAISIKDIVSIIIEEDAAELRAVKKTAKVKAEDKAELKKAGIIASMKSYIKESDNDLYQSYCNWVESVYENKRFLTHKIIDIFQAAINDFSADKTTKLNLLNCAIISGYTDPAWVIGQYKSNTKQINKPASIQTPARISVAPISATEIRTDVAF